MKKFISLITVLCMALSFAVVVSADGTTVPIATEGTLNSSDEVDVTFSSASWVAEINDEIQSGEGNPSYLIDKKITKNDGRDSGNAWNAYFNFLLGSKGGTLTITLTADDVIDNFAGIRFYTRRNNSTTELVTSDNVNVATVSVSEDGKKYYDLDEITTTLSSATEDYEANRWAQSGFKVNDKTVAVSGAKYIKIKVTKLFNDSQHFGCEEISLLLADSETVATVSDIAKGSAEAKIDEIGSYSVYGGVERKSLIDTAESYYNTLSADEQAAISYAKTKLDDYKEKYDHAANKEVAASLSATESKAYAADGALRYNYDTYARMTDGYINKVDAAFSSSTFSRGDYAFWANSDHETGKLAPSYMIVKFDVNSEVAFSGVRFYARRYDDGTGYDWNSVPYTADITLKGADGTAYVVKDVTGVIAVADTDASGGKDYSDLKFFNDGTAVTGVTGVEVKIKSLGLNPENLGKGQHFGSEEVRLIVSDGGTEKSLTEVSVSGVPEMIEKIGEYPVFSGIERKKLIDAARTAVNGLTDSQKSAIASDITTLEGYEKAYSDEAAKEVDATIEVTNLKSYKIEGTVINDMTGSQSLMTDGYVNKVDGKGNKNTYPTGDTFVRGDYALGQNGKSLYSGAYIQFDLAINSNVAFSGLRFYARRSDGNAGRVAASMPDVAEITLYGDDDKALYIGTLRSKKQITSGEGSSLSDVYADYTFTVGDSKVKFTDVKKATVKIIKLNSSNMHFGCEELRLIEHDGASEKTIDSVREDVFCELVDEIGNYSAYAGLERNNLLTQAVRAKNILNNGTTLSEKAVAALDKLIEYENAYIDASTQEIAATIYADGCKNSQGNAQTGIFASFSEDGTEQRFYETKGMLDGYVPDKSVVGRNSEFSRGDHAFNSLDTTPVSMPTNYIALTLNTDPKAEFSGIRFYGRRQDNTANYITESLIKNVEVKLYDKDGKLLDLGDLVGVKPRTTDAADEEMYSDIEFVLNDGEDPVIIYGVAKIEIKIKSLNSSPHFGCEEIRLINHKEADTCFFAQAVTEKLVKFKNITFSAEASGEEGGKTATLRIVSGFDNIDSSATVTEFGIYAFDLAAFSKVDEGGISNVNGIVNVLGNSYASYKKSEGDFELVAKGNTFAVDVTEIPEASFGKTIMSFAFCKIDGIEDYAISGSAYTTVNKVTGVDTGEDE